MTAAPLLRVLAAMLFAIMASALWATPGEAHAGHEEPGAVAQVQAPASMDAVAKPARGESAVASTDHAAPAAAAGCADDPAQPGKTACCGFACHAAMAEDLVALKPRAEAAIAAPDRPGPPALAGPASHLKRPPRSQAASAA